MELSATYTPTRKERLLLETLLNPENKYATVQEVCRIAKIERSTYYRAFRKPSFVALYSQESRSLIRYALAPIINSCIKFAVRGSAQHAKILLTMAGEYIESKNVTFPDENGKPQKVGPVMIYIPDNGRD